MSLANTWDGSPTPNSSTAGDFPSKPEAKVSAPATGYVGGHNATSIHHAGLIRVLKKREPEAIHPQPRHPNPLERARAVSLQEGFAAKRRPINNSSNACASSSTQKGFAGVKDTKPAGGVGTSSIDPVHRQHWQKPSHAALAEGDGATVPMNAGAPVAAKWSSPAVNVQRTGAQDLRNGTRLTIYESDNAATRNVGTVGKRRAIKGRGAGSEGGGGGAAGAVGFQDAELVAWLNNSVLFPKGVVEVADTRSTEQQLQSTPLRSLSDLTQQRQLLSRAVSKIAGTDNVKDVSGHQSRPARGRSSPLQRRRSSDGGSGSVSSFGSAESRQLREGSSGELFPRELTESSSSLDDSGVVSVGGDGSLAGLSGGGGGAGGGGGTGVRAVLSEYDSGGRGGGGRSSRHSSERMSAGRRGGSIRSLFGSLPNGRKKTPSKASTARKMKQDVAYLLSGKVSADSAPPKLPGHMGSAVDRACAGDLSAVRSLLSMLRDHQTILSAARAYEGGKVGLRRRSFSCDPSPRVVAASTVATVAAPVATVVSDATKGKTGPVTPPGELASVSGVDALIRKPVSMMSPPPPPPPPPAPAGAAAPVVEAQVRVSARATTPSTQRQSPAATAVATVFPPSTSAKTLSGAPPPVECVEGNDPGQRSSFPWSASSSPALAVPLAMSCPWAPSPNLGPGPLSDPLGPWPESPALGLASSARKKSSVHRRASSPTLGIASVKRGGSKRRESLTRDTVTAAGVLMDDPLVAREGVIFKDTAAPTASSKELVNPGGVACEGEVPDAAVVRSNRDQEAAIWEGGRHRNRHVKEESAPSSTFPPRASRSSQPNQSTTLPVDPPLGSSPQPPQEQQQQQQQQSSVFDASVSQALSGLGSAAAAVQPSAQSSRRSSSQSSSGTRASKRSSSSSGDSQIPHQQAVPRRYPAATVAPSAPPAAIPQPADASTTRTLLSLMEASPSQQLHQQTVAPQRQPSTSASSTPPVEASPVVGSATAARARPVESSVAAQPAVPSRHFSAAPQQADTLPYKETWTKALSWRSRPPAETGSSARSARSRSPQTSLRPRPPVRPPSKSTTQALMPSAAVAAAAAAAAAAVLPPSQAAAQTTAAVDSCANGNRAGVKTGERERVERVVDGGGEAGPAPAESSGGRRQRTRAESGKSEPRRSSGGDRDASGRVRPSRRGTGDDTSLRRRRKYIDSTAVVPEVAADAAAAAARKTVRRQGAAGENEAVTSNGDTTTAEVADASSSGDNRLEVVVEVVTDKKEGAGITNESRPLARSRPVASIALGRIDSASDEVAGGAGDAWPWDDTVEVLNGDAGGRISCDPATQGVGGGAVVSTTEMLARSNQQWDDTSVMRELTNAIALREQEKDDEAKALNIGVVAGVMKEGRPPWDDGVGGGDDGIALSPRGGGKRDYDMDDEKVGSPRPEAVDTAVKKQEGISTPMMARVSNGEIKASPVGGEGVRMDVDTAMQIDTDLVTMAGSGVEAEVGEALVSAAQAFGPFCPHGVRMVVEFVGSVEGVARAGVVSTAWRSAIRADEDRLYKMVVRRAGVTARRRAAFWEHMVLRRPPRPGQASPPADALRSAPHGCSPSTRRLSLSELSHRGMRSVWSKAIDADVARTFGRPMSHRGDFGIGKRQDSRRRHWWPESLGGAPLGARTPRQFSQSVNGDDVNDAARPAGSWEEEDEQEDPPRPLSATLGREDADASGKGAEAGLHGDFLALGGVAGVPPAPLGGEENGRGGCSGKFTTVSTDPDSTQDDAGGDPRVSLSTATAMAPGGSLSVAVYSTLSPLGSPEVSDFSLDGGDGNGAGSCGSEGAPPSPSTLRQLEVVKGQLTDALRALAVSFGEVGYCQGLDYVVAHLIKCLGTDAHRGFASDPERVFAVLIGLFQNYSLQHIYSEDLEALQLMLGVLDLLIEARLPRLHKHFRQQDVDVAFFAVGWFQTLFLYTSRMPSDTLLWLWDVWVTERSYKVFFRAALAILLVSESKLLELDMESIMTYLSRFPRDSSVVLDKNVLVPAALSIKVTDSMLREAQRKLDLSKKIGATGVGWTRPRVPESPDHDPERNSGTVASSATGETGTSGPNHRGAPDDGPAALRNTEGGGTGNGNHGRGRAGGAAADAGGSSAYGRTDNGVERRGAGDPRKGKGSPLIFGDHSIDARAVSEVTVGIQGEAGGGSGKGGGASSFGVDTASLSGGWSGQSGASGGAHGVCREAFGVEEEGEEELEMPTASPLIFGAHSVDVAATRNRGGAWRPSVVVVGAGSSASRRNVGDDRGSAAASSRLGATYQTVSPSKVPATPPSLLVRAHPANRRALPSGSNVEGAGESGYADDDGDERGEYDTSLPPEMEPLARAVEVQAAAPRGHWSGENKGGGSGDGVARQWVAKGQVAGTTASDPDAASKTKKLGGREEYALIAAGNE